MNWNIGIVLYLFVGSIFDLRTKKVPTLLLIGGLILAIAKLCIQPFDSLGESIFSISLGLIMIIIAWLCRRHIGMADGIALLTVGMILGGDLCILIFCLALFVESFVGIPLMVLKIAQKETELPFFPFLGIGYFLTRLMGMN